MLIVWNHVICCMVRCDTKQRKHQLVSLQRTVIPSCFSYSLKKQRHEIVTEAQEDLRTTEVE